MRLAAILVWALIGYACAGGIFALFFARGGAARIDPAAKGAGWGFRLLISPGVAALWPWLLPRWIRGGERVPVERTSHRRERGEAAR